MAVPGRPTRGSVVRPGSKATGGEEAAADPASVRRNSPTWESKMIEDARLSVGKQNAAGEKCDYERFPYSPPTTTKKSDGEEKLT